VEEEQETRRLCETLLAKHEHVGDPEDSISFIFMSMDREDVSELRPPSGLLLIHKMAYEYGELRRNNTVRGKPKN
jgi:hypothetical protein